MPRKTLRVRDVSGRWVEIEPGEVCPPPIRHKSLDTALLLRIALVHRALQDALTAPAGQTMSLGQFEVSFMRCDSPGDEVSAWEAVSLALEKAQGLYPPEQCDRQSLYRQFLFMLCGALTDEELREEGSIMLTQCFQSSHSASRGATVGRDATAATCYDLLQAGA